MSKIPFIGIGNNPDGVNLPLGPGMRLAQDPKATEAFGAMSQTQKSELISYIKSASTGDEAEKRVDEALKRLSGNVE